MRLDQNELVTVMRILINALAFFGRMFISAVVVFAKQ